MAQDKHLRILLGFIFVLVIAALAVFVLQQRGQPAYSLGTEPADVVNNFFVALHQNDFEKAYGYIQPSIDNPSIEFWEQGLNGRYNNDVIAIYPVDTTYGLVETEATVHVEVVHMRVSTTGDRWTEDAYISLRKDANGDWRITNLPYPYDRIFD